MIVLISRNIWRQFHTPPVLKRLMKYSEGSFHETRLSDEGIIVPLLHYYVEEEAREIVRRSRKQREKPQNRDYQLKRISNRVTSYSHRSMELEMELMTIDDDTEMKIVDDRFDDDDAIIDEILTLPLDSVMLKQLVPDRLLTPEKRQCQDLAAPEVSLPQPLTPAYLPSRPVSGVWSSRHSTQRLYRYTHFERLVYPHDRVIVPRAFLPLP